MVRRTKQEAQATRELLLDTAEQVFLERGVSGSSLQDIAAAAGLTRGAIYWHFADKMALFDAMMARIGLPMEQALCTAGQAGDAGPEPDPVARLRTLALAPFALMQRDPRARRVFTVLMHRAEFVGELAPLALRKQGVHNEWLQRNEALFDAARRAGRLADGMSPATAALALVALVDGLLRLMAQPLGGEVPAPVAEQAIDALLAGLTKPPAPPPG